MFSIVNTKYEPAPIQEFSIPLALGKNNILSDILICVDVPIPLCHNNETILYSSELSALKCVTKYMSQSRSGDTFITHYSHPSKALGLTIKNRASYLTGYCASFQAYLTANEIRGNVGFHLHETNFEQFMTNMKWLSENAMPESKVSFQLSEKDFDLFLTDVIVKEKKYSHGRIEINFARNDKVNYVKTGF